MCEICILVEGCISAIFKLLCGGDLLINTKIRRMPSRNRQIHESWMAIQDAVGPAAQWSTLVWRLFWTPLPLFKSLGEVNDLYICVRTRVEPNHIHGMGNIDGPCQGQSGAKSFLCHFQVFYFFPFKLVIISGSILMDTMESLFQIIQYRQELYAVRMGCTCKPDTISILKMAEGGGVFRVAKEKNK